MSTDKRIGHSSHPFTQYLRFWAGVRLAAGHPLLRIFEGEARDVASSDRITLYIGTYTRRESFVDGKAEGIYIWIDGDSGTLRATGHVAAVPTPVCLQLVSA